MEKKQINSLLFEIGYILFAFCICLYLIFLQIPGPISPLIIIITIIGILGIICIITGALLRKKDVGEWLVILGLIQMFTGVLLAAICAIFDWNLPTLQEFIIPLELLGILFIIGGGLTPEKKKS